MNCCVTTRRAAAAAAARAHCACRWAHIKTGPRKPGFVSKTKAKATEPTILSKPASQVRPRPAPSPSPTSRSKPRPQSSPPPQSEDTLLSVWRATWLPLSGAALVAGALGFYIFGTAAATLKAGPCSCEADHHHHHDATPTGRPPALTGDNAEQFDKELDWPEFWMGITSLRRRLAAHARGDVLELAMGSGRNLEYYDWSPITAAIEAAKDETHANKAIRAAKGITSFTGLDISVDMLDVARRKLTKTVPPLKASAPVVSASSMADSTGGQLAFLSGRLRLVHSDAHHPLPGAPTTTASSSSVSSGSNGSKKYDSIIQTFGLCSVADPVAVLRNLASAVKPGTGRIVLLEHGKGYYGLVNGLLDRNAARHFDRYGCWWNRDIEALVEEAARATPGLTVVRVERPKVLQMGTLVWVELKVEEQTSATGSK
ncbi:hypothetical protein V2A60_006574 [Cordyceps javanica]|uniref:Ubiquinone/menaquinone biosynthesis-related protein n=1 Tax=Cordyceps javanica TaxID=43265 RepID=A0A545V7K3_9HYPO|nr:ubiquinone/menaquinone biosynthesis-related protein [Cordyceps javanica]TQW09130.1 ubiquinone/menaquinone biosynthesis-related protein [Cordyceps javanica]